MRCKAGARVCRWDQPQRGRKAAAQEQMDEVSEVRARCGWCSAPTAALQGTRGRAIMRRTQGSSQAPPSLCFGATSRNPGLSDTIPLGLRTVGKEQDLLWPKGNVAFTVFVNPPVKCYS